MKIELTAGCTVDSLQIDGKRFEDLSYREMRDIIFSLVTEFTDEDLYNDIIRNIVYSKGEFKDGYACEQCGDFVETYTLEI
jgi:hypothetical protein